MAYREVTVIEIEEVLRQWIAEVPIKRIARRVGLDEVAPIFQASIGSRQGGACWLFAHSVLRVFFQ